MDTMDEYDQYMDVMYGFNVCIQWMDAMDGCDVMD